MMWCGGWVCGNEERMDALRRKAQNATRKTARDRLVKREILSFCQHARLDSSKREGRLNRGDCMDHF